MNETEKRLLSYVEEHQQELYGILSKLVSFDSQNFITSGRELTCQNYIKELYTELGLETEMYSPDDVPGLKEHEGYLPGRGLADRPNVTGVQKGFAPTRSVMLAAHTDTMPTGEMSKWTVDPFGGEIKEGRLYGLGSGDNKFGIASGYFALKVLKECGVTLRDTVVLTAYVDEEYGGGDGAFAACVKYPCDSYINFDGGNYEMWIAALGGGGFEIKVELDGTTTDTCEPVTDALIEIKNMLKPFAQRRREELHKNPLFIGSDMERAAYRLSSFKCGNSGSDLDHGCLQFVIYTDKSKEQILEELNDIEKKIHPMLKERGMRTDGFKHTTRFFKYQESALDESYRTLKVAAEEAVGHEIKACGACLSDLSVFLPYGGESSLNFGILRDFSLYGGAHQPDEFVELDQFLAHAKATVLYLYRYCGGK